VVDDDGGCCKFVFGGKERRRTGKKGKKEAKKTAKDLEKMIKKGRRGEFAGSLCGFLWNDDTNTL